ADAAADVDVAQDAGAGGVDPHHGAALDGDPAVQPAADVDVAEDVAQRDDEAVEPAGGHGDATEAGQGLCRGRTHHGVAAGVRLDDADVALGGHDAVQVAMEVDEAHQVGGADDPPGAGEAPAPRADERDAGDRATGVGDRPAEVAGRRLDGAGDGAVGDVDVADDAR